MADQANSDYANETPARITGHWDKAMESERVRRKFGGGGDKTWSKSSSKKKKGQDGEEL